MMINFLYFRPVSKKLNPSTLRLTHTVVESFDEVATTFISDLINCCSDFKMTVFGQDQSLRLHVRLFFKAKDAESFFCLNDVLCEEKYAKNREPSSDIHCLKIQPGTDYWATLAVLPSQLAVEDEIRTHALGISDYAKAFDQERQKKLSEKNAEKNRKTDESKSIPLVNKKDIKESVENNSAKGNSFSQQESRVNSAVSLPFKSSSVSSPPPFNSPARIGCGRGSLIVSSYLGSKEGSSMYQTCETPNPRSLLSPEQYTQRLKSTLHAPVKPVLMSPADFAGRGSYRHVTSPPSVQPGSIIENMFFLLIKE